MSTPKNYLLPASGFAILGIALLLVSPPVSHAVPSDKDVRVINTTLEPVPVVNINDAGQPFQTSASATQLNSNVSSVNITTVPAGKRLVIEFISFTAQVPPGQNAEIMQISTISGPVGGVSHQLLIHEQPQAVIGDSIFRAVQHLRLYANPGTTVSALFRRNTGAGNATYGVTISGYLVNVP